MPHSRSYKPRAVQREDSEVPDIPQTRESSSGPGLNEYLNWDLPEFAYQEDSLAEMSAPDANWYASDRATYAQPTRNADAPDSTRDAAHNLSDTNFNQSSGAEFCGLQHWYSSATQHLSNAPSDANARPQLEDSAYSSCESTPFGEADTRSHQLTATLPWSPESSRGLASFDEALPQPKRSSTKEAESVKELENSLSPSSAEEIDRSSAASKMDANRKRKIAHSLIEKNYRSRIKDGMAELRDCVPSTWIGRTSSLDSSKTEPQDTAKAHQNHSSGKVATLSDAVQYVKSLELRNEALHGKLSVIRRRNYTLQKIALSKVDTSHPPEDEAFEELDTEEVLQLAERSTVPNSRKRSKTSPSGRHRP
jgi:Helix-loop-helix DNA-binding domain